MSGAECKGCLRCHWSVHLLQSLQTCSQCSRCLQNPKQRGKPRIPPTQHTEDIQTHPHVFQSLKLLLTCQSNEIGVNDANKEVSDVGNTLYFDIIIVGAGSSGVSMAYQLQKLLRTITSKYGL